MDRVASLTLLLVACSVDSDHEPALERASLIVEAPGDTGVGTRDARHAVNGVRGAGALAGSLDVFTVSEPLVLGFRGLALPVDGPDLVVFENAFDVVGGVGRFMDPAIVEVSADCDDWIAFPHEYLGDLGEPSDDPADWLGFAGIEPVLWNEDVDDLDPFDPATGGDRFELDDLPEGHAARELGVACVRISAATDYPMAPISDGPDIDGIYAARVQ